MSIIPPPHAKFSVSAPRAAENKQQTSNPLASQISSKYWPITHHLLLATSQQHNARSVLVLLLFFPDITCHQLRSLSTEGQILMAKRKKGEKSAHAHTEWQTRTQSHTVAKAKKKKKVLTCILRQSLRYYSPDLGRFVNIPGYSLDVVQASTLIFCSIFIQSVEQTRTQVFFPPSLLQDRCERSWPSRSTCIPAVKLARRQETPL